MPRPKRLFLHIGLPKTGTTAWQEWADRHRAALRAQGLDYPEADTVSDSPNHSAIQPGIMKRDPARLRRFLAEGRCDTMLLSSEGLSNNLTQFPEEGLRQFRAEVSGIEVICIVTVRPAAEWLRSIYRQSVLNRTNARMGNGTAEPIEVFAERPRIRMMLDRENLPGHAARAFGAVRCDVIAYGDGAFSRFCSILGVSAASIPGPEVVNVSAPAAVEKVMLRVNALGAGDDVREAVLWLMRQAVPAGHNRLLSAERPAASAARSAVGLLETLQAPDAEAAALIRRLHDIAVQEFG